VSTALAISGWHRLGPAGGTGAALPDTPLPPGPPPVLVDVDVRARLGRKGTSFYDRVTGFAVVACDAAIRDAGLLVDDGNRARVGIVLGTTVGSFRSTSDYSRETLVQQKPYLVNPMLFPNTVMNCAAGQAAIRLRLRGVNATVAGGRIAVHHALRFAQNAMDRMAMDAMLVGAVEEFSPHRAWNAHLTSPSTGTAEGGAVFVLERGPARTGVHLLGVAAGFGWRERAPAALGGCVARVLAEAGVASRAVSLVVTGGAETGLGSEYAVAADVLSTRPRHLAPAAELGECDAATGALSLAAALEVLAREPDTVALFTAAGPDGGVAAGLVGRPR